MFNFFIRFSNNFSPFPSGRVMSNIIKSILELFIPQVAVQVYTVLDKTMIGAIVNDKSDSSKPL